MKGLLENKWSVLFGVVFAAVMSMGVSSCAGVPAIRTGDKNVDRVLRMIQSNSGAAEGLLPIGYEEERLIGRKMAKALAKKFGGLLDDSGLSLYVNLVGSAVALESKRPDIPYFFGVLNSDSINAFACPGGYIFVTKGALRRIESEAELGGVLAHEIAHVANKHILNAIRRAQVVKGTTQITIRSLNSNLAMMTSMIDVGLETLVNKGLSKGEENEADTEGTIYAGHLGYHPGGLSWFVNKLGELRKQTGRGDGQNLSAFFSTHPGVPDRLESIQSAIASLKLPPSKEGKWLRERFRSRTAGRI